MAAYGWRQRASVEEGLFAEGHTFDFFQAVRLLESLERRAAEIEGRPERVPPAEGVDPERELVRFRSRIDLGFAPTDIDSLRRGDDGEPAEMEVNFLGLAGATGPLPRALTELILKRCFKKDTAFRDFLDVFNHRLVSILYRARKKYRTALHWRSPEESPSIRPGFALIGMGTGRLESRLHVRDRALLLYTGLLSRGAKSMIGLERLLEDYFDCGAAVAPYRGRWYRLADDQVTLIGPSGRNRRLGDSVVLGTRVWDQAAGCEIEIGPLGFERFVDFLPLEEPGGGGYRALTALGTFYLGQDVLFRVRLVLEAAEVPPLALGGDAAARLGWTSWLRSTEFTKDDSQVVLDPEEEPWRVSSRH